MFVMILRKKLKLHENIYNRQFIQYRFCYVVHMWISIWREELNVKMFHHNKIVLSLVPNSSQLLLFNNKVGTFRLPLTLI